MVLVNCFKIYTRNYLSVLFCTDVSLQVTFHRTLFKKCTL